MFVYKEVSLLPKKLILFSLELCDVHSMWRNCGHLGAESGFSGLSNLPIKPM